MPLPLLALFAVGVQGGLLARRQLTKKKQFQSERDAFGAAMELEDVRCANAQANEGLLADLCRPANERDVLRQFGEADPVKGLEFIRATGEERATAFQRARDFGFKREDIDLRQSQHTLALDKFAQDQANAAKPTDLGALRDEAIARKGFIPIVDRQGGFIRAVPTPGLAEHTKLEKDLDDDAAALGRINEFQRILLDAHRQGKTIGASEQDPDVTAMKGLATQIVFDIKRIQQGGALDAGLVEIAENIADDPTDFFGQATTNPLAIATRAQAYAQDVSRVAIRSAQAVDQVPGIAPNTLVKADESLGIRRILSQVIPETVERERERQAALRGTGTIEAQQAGVDRALGVIPSAFRGLGGLLPQFLQP